MIANYANFLLNDDTWNNLMIICLFLPSGEIPNQSLYSMPISAIDEL